MAAETFQVSADEGIFGSTGEREEETVLAPKRQPHLAAGAVNVAFMHAKATLPPWLQQTILGLQFKGREEALRMRHYLHLPSALPVLMMRRGFGFLVFGLDRFFPPRKAALIHSPDACNVMHTTYVFDLQPETYYWLQLYRRLSYDAPLVAACVYPCSTLVQPHANPTPLPSLLLRMRLRWWSVS